MSVAVNARDQVLSAQHSVLKFYRYRVAWVMSLFHDEDFGLNVYLLEWSCTT
jgi:hypothetical protein